MITTAMEVNAQRYDEAVQDALKLGGNEQEAYETALFNNLINGYTGPLYTSPSPRDRHISRMPSSA